MNNALKMLQYTRAGARMNSRVKVEMEWEENGKARKEIGYTVDISTKGCMAIAPEGPGVGQKLRLRTESTQKVTVAVLIWRGHEGRTGWELGLELVDPPEDFWGMDL